MTFYLTFTLMAPLASFGGVAVGERRSGDDRPAKSAVFGLLAASLGLERDNTAAHAALASELFYAVRSENMKVRTPRRLMTDYQTAQSPPRARNQYFATRRAEVADKQKLGTILSYREYRSDCSFTIALWPRGTSLQFQLEELAGALRKPLFTPYAGRKACPLMLPMQPLIYAADNLRGALAQRDELHKQQKEFLERYNLSTQPNTLAFDTDSREETGDRRERRRDEIIDRGRWQFGLRDETIGRWEGGAA